MQQVLSRTKIETPELVGVVKALQVQSIEYEGPFLTSKGRIVFRVENKIVFDWELIVLFGAGNLNRSGISTLLSRIRA